MALKGKEPEKKEKRLKMFVFGEAGVGKTLAALMFPKAYIIDTEKGSDFYADTINASGSAVFQSNNPDDIREEIKTLLTTKHDYRTLIIDPVTIVYGAIQEKWTRVFSANAKTEKESELQDFGMRYWGKVKGEFKAMQRMLMALDMNVIVTAHQKDVYGPNFSKVGVTFELMRGDDYFFDLIFRVKKMPDGRRFAETIKERAEIGKNKFPIEFEWGFSNFEKFYGAEIINKASDPVEMATVYDVAFAKSLVDTLKVEDTTVAKWFQAADVDEWDQMTKPQIIKYTEAMRKRITALQAAGDAAAPAVPVVPVPAADAKPAEKAPATAAKKPGVK